MVGCGETIFINFRMQCRPGDTKELSCLCPVATADFQRFFKQQTTNVVDTVIEKML